MPVKRGGLAAIVVALGVAASASAHHMTAPPPFTPNLGPGESNTGVTVPPLLASSFPQEEHVGFHEFQVDCAVNRVAADDPIVFPRMPGASHSHTFVGGRAGAKTTTASLSSGRTSCTTPGDHSAYWFPTMSLRGRRILPKGPQIVYYKAGVDDYGAVRAFPRGLRFVIGNPKATEAQFKRDSGVSGWTCSDDGPHYDFPASCAKGSQLLVRYKAPSCWDGTHLDSPDHKSHMAYPVRGRCPVSHPVAVPMLEYKIAYPVDGDLRGLRLASGRGYSWHADFFSAWDMPTQEALVTQCIDGGGQCDASGYDQHKPDRGRVLDAAGRLPSG